MRDSVEPSAIPLENLAAVAGYGDGRWVWSPADWARFPESVVPLSIVVSAQNIGDILDVETGDATPADVPGWVKRFNRPGRRRPTIYSNRETWPSIVKALTNAGLDASAVDWWAATLDGVTKLVVGAVAVQYAGAQHTGGNYDESVIIDPSWIDVPVTPISHPGGTTMFAFHPSGARHDMVFVTGNGTNFIHAWSSSIEGDDAPNANVGEESWGVPQGKTLVAGTAFVGWDVNGDMMWGAQATDGSWWNGWGDINAGNKSGWQRWFNFSSDVPTTPPPTSNSFVKHTHVTTTDDGTPVA